MSLPSSFGQAWRSAYAPTTSPSLTTHRTSHTVTRTQPKKKAPERKPRKPPSRCLSNPKPRSSLTRLKTTSSAWNTCPNVTVSSPDCHYAANRLCPQLLYTSIFSAVPDHLTLDYSQATTPTTLRTSPSKAPSSTCPATRLTVRMDRTRVSLVRIRSQI